MKRFVLFSFLTVALVFSMAQANAGKIAINVDEFGNGTTDFPSTTLHPLTSFTAPDASGGVAGTVLAYQLPFTTVQGDVYLNDSAVALVLGDVIRFFNIGNNGFLIFYSDNGDGVDAAADSSGLPTGQVPTNIVTLTEIGPEGLNGVTYTPVAGNPGYVSTDFTPTYTIASDSVAPEPGSVLLIAAGLAGLGLLKFRR